MVEKSSRDLFDFPYVIIARALDIVSCGKIITSLFVSWLIVTHILIRKDDIEMY